MRIWTRLCLVLALPWYVAVWIWAGTIGNSALVPAWQEFLLIFGLGSVPLFLVFLFGAGIVWAFRAPPPQ